MSPNPNPNRARRALPTYARNPPRPLPDRKDGLEAVEAAAEAGAVSTGEALTLLKDGVEAERRARLWRKVILGLRIAGLLAVPVVTSLASGGVAVPGWIIGLSTGLGTLAAILGGREGHMFEGLLGGPGGHDLPPLAR